MEKLLKLFDEIADKYNIEDEDRKQFAEAINNLGGDIVTEGDEANLPDMGDEDGNEDEEDELAFH